MREQPPTYRRPDAVRADEQVALLAAAFGELHSYPAGAGDPVAGHRPPEVDDVGQAGEQALPEGVPVHVGDLVVGDSREGLRRHLLQAMGVSGHQVTVDPTRTAHQVERLRCQAGPQRGVAVGVDVDAVALVADRRRGVLLVHGDVQAVAAQRLGERQAADTAAGDENPWSI
ncbi:hypothetical protein GCM10023196_044600 [Actinoallomurus vinaceus]|uniref:Uncharacterized protein n=1 Tax=Actinoallomurus vinaceus TaxID=1080074 RepID=A0ABP8UE34_9ACTN